MQEAGSRPAAAQLENHKLIAHSRVSARPNLAADVARAKAFLSAKAAAATEGFDQGTAAVQRVTAELEALPATATPQQRQALLMQLDAANSRVNSARDALNSEWRANNSASTSPVSGIQVDRTSNQTQEGSGVNFTSALGDANLGSTTRTRTDIEELNSEGGVDSTFGDDEESEEHRGKASRSEPSHERNGGRFQAGADERNGHRHHPAECESFQIQTTFF